MKKVWAAAIAVMFAASASAAPPDGVDPDCPLAQWYRSLRTPDTGVSCCSVADCRPVQARQVEDHWEVLTEDGWRVVPAQRVLQRRNMDGRPIACQVLGRVRCFVPPPGA
jgi:hypothetical protein